VLAPISWRVPPVHYGPWELFASLLTEGLVARGHEVTLFASGDSVTTATLSSVVAAGWSEDPTIDAKVAECTHIAAAFERSAEFDVLHNSFDFLPLTYSRLVSTPLVTTIHGLSSERILGVYERYDDRSAYVAISDSDRRDTLSYAATIHHGIDVDAFGLHDAPGEHLLFFGRIHPDKGTAEAVQVARSVGRPLVIAGIVHDEAYFAEQVAPHIDGDRVRFMGPVAASDRCATLGAAHALLHLIGFDEPFGFSVAESMACGTPVIAFDRGSMRELIEDGRTGFVVGDVGGAVAAVSRVGDLDRSAIRATAVERFHHDRMVDAYIDVYERVLEEAR
jgi:glycosyltransferase involved in cell wall biosynthesis